jgi:tetratricopeptide (TPR) repeat protein
MFFSRLRRRAKWVFLALAVVFAGSFVFLGVGAGGSGVGDYLADLFGGAGSDTPSVSDARAKVEANPDDLEARRELATALQADGQIAAAIPHLERYTEGRPRDVDALATLAGLFGARAQEQQAELQEAQAGASGSGFASEIMDPTSPLAEGFTGPITKMQQETTATEVNELILEATGTYAKQADVWERLTKLQPEEANHYLQLGQARYYAGAADEAITAWERFLELAPDDPNAPLVRRQLRTLRESAQPTATDEN